MALQSQLCEDPYPPDGPAAETSPIKQLKETSLPNSFTAPFDDGFLSYQVKADHPLIEPLGVIWV